MYFQRQIITEADRFMQLIDGGGYRVPLTLNEYIWGSNSIVMNHALVLALAYDLTGEDAYLYGVTESMDYVLGQNALAFSFVTGYGSAYAQHQHHRFWANQGSFPPPPPGWLRGE